MYLFSFIKSLLKPRNFLSSVYFLLNAAFVFLVFYILPIEIVEDKATNSLILGLIGLGVNGVFIMLSLTPMGEAFWRYRNNIKKRPDAVYSDIWQTVNDVFDEVKGRAREYSRSVSRKVKLYYSATKDINAYALGHRTVIITQGMLYSHPEYLKGVFAHELGHIAHGDSDLKLGINVANSIITTFVTVISAFAYTVAAMLYNSENDLVHLVGLLISIFLNVIIVGVFRLWSLVGVLCVNVASRKAEYQADGFADEIGYGEQLARFLDALDGNAPRTSRFNLMFQTHPDTADRLEALGFTYAAA